MSDVKLKLNENVTANMALQRPAVQSSTYSSAVAGRAVDGDIYTVSCTLGPTTSHWWTVDLGEAMDVGRVCITNDRNENYG